MNVDVDLTQEFDARIWSKEWLKTIKDHPNIPTDEDCMISWFSNALMAGFDECNRRYHKIKERNKKLNWIEEEALSEKINLALGEASMCWKPIPSGIFQTDKALEIGNELFNFIVDEVNECSNK